MARVDGWTTPLNILFFVISGAELDLQVLAQPVTLIVDNLGIPLLPLAGVALGMALNLPKHEKA